MAATGALRLVAALCVVLGGTALPAAVASAQQPLTASFDSIPDSHDGSSSFEVRIRFSEELKNRALGGKVVRVTNGDNTGSVRVDGAGEVWEITIQPGGNDDVTIKLVAGDNDQCGSGLACTTDFRPLSATLEDTVEGPTDPDPDPDNDDPDGSRDGAVDLGDITEVTKTQYPMYTIDQDGDAVDYFRFSLTVPRFVTVGVRQLDAGARITVEDADGAAIRSKAGTEHAMTYGTLLEGTYYVRVEATGNGENEYRLAHVTRDPNADKLAELRAEREAEEIESDDPVVDGAGDTEETFEVPDVSFDLGNITGLDAERSHRFSVNGDGDAEDWFTFTLSRARTVRLGLSLLESDVDLFLLDDGGGLLAASRNSGATDESVAAALEEGSYFVGARANEQQFDTYALSVALDGASTVDDPVTFEDPPDTIDLGDIAGRTAQRESTADFEAHLDTEQWFKFSLSRSQVVDLRLVDVKVVDLNGPLMELWSDDGDRLHDSRNRYDTYIANGKRLTDYTRRYDYLDERLDAGSYYVRVVPHNYHTGESMVESPISFKHRALPDMAAAPSGLTVGAAPGGMRVTWQAPRVHADAVTGYVISRRKPDASDRSYRVVVADTGSQQRQYLDTTATDDATRYQYRIKALRGTVASEWSPSTIGYYAATEQGDYASNTTTHGAVEVGGSTNGWIGRAGDVDYIRVALEAGREYKVVAEPRNVGRWTLAVKLRVARDASDVPASPLGHYRGTVASQQYLLPEATGNYFIVVSAASTNSRFATGPYKVSVADVTSSARQNLAEVAYPDVNLNGVTPESLSPDEWAELLESPDYLGAKPPYRYGRPIFDTNVLPWDHVGVVAPGGSTYGRLETPGNADLDGDGTVDLDVDIVKMRLQFGRLYRIDVEGQDTGHGTLADPRIIAMKGPGLLYTVPNGDEDSGAGRNATVFWTPTETGDHYIAIISECCGFVPSGRSEDSYRTGSYRVAVRDLTTEAPAETEDTSTPARAPVGGRYVGLLGAIGEVDWVAMDLDADHTYTVSASAEAYRALGIGPVGAAGIRSIRDELGRTVWSARDCVTSVEFRPTRSGTYYATVEERIINSDSIGGYKLELVEIEQQTDQQTDQQVDQQVDQQTDQQTVEEPIEEPVEQEEPMLDDEPPTITVGSPLNGSIFEGTDTDEFTVQLNGGTAYVIDMEGAWTGGFDDDYNWVSIATLFDPIILGVYATDDPDTNLIPSNSRHDDAGEGKNSRLQFTPTGTGGYRIEVGSGSGWTGTYVLTVAEASQNN